MSTPDIHCFIGFAVTYGLTSLAPVGGASTVSNTAVIATSMQIYLGLSIASWKGCRTDRTNKHSPLRFPAGSCRTKGFPVCCHSPSVFSNKGELRLAAWYKPNTRCSSINKVPCPYGGNLVQNAKANRYHLRFTDLPAEKYWSQYPTIRRFWKHQGRKSRRLFDPYWKIDG